MLFTNLFWPKSKPETWQIPTTREIQEHHNMPKNVAQIIHDAATKNLESFDETSDMYCGVHTFTVGVLLIAEELALIAYGALEEICSENKTEEENEKLILPLLRKFYPTAFHEAVSNSRVKTRESDVPLVDSTLPEYPNVLLKQIIFILKSHDIDLAMDKGTLMIQQEMLQDFEWGKSVDLNELGKVFADCLDERWCADWSSSRRRKKSTVKSVYGVAIVEYASKKIEMLSKSDISEIRNSSVFW